MCLIFISFKQHPTYKLIVAANRDEFYARETAPAKYWDDAPNILAGRDLVAGGTWMGMTKSGRISLLTNYRDVRNIKPDAPSRGHLVSRYLETNTPPEQYLKNIQPDSKAFNGFNLIVGDTDRLLYYSNYQDKITKLQPGLFGLSNHLLDSPWPKVVRGKQKLGPFLTRPTLSADDLMEVLFDDVVALDTELPDTGLAPERERALSSMFIKAGNYGSRSTSVVLADYAGHVTFAERVYDTSTFSYKTSEFHFNIKDQQ